MVLCDSQIRERVHDEDDELNISPFYDQSVQPASYDLSLGREFRILEPPSWYSDIKRMMYNCIPFVDTRSSSINPDEELETQLPTCELQGDTFVLAPNDFVLAHTQEYIEMPDDQVGVIHGRSSWARLGVNPHLGGYIDPGFKGQITLELSNLTSVPIELPIGERFCQLVYFEMSQVPEESYNGKYQGDEGAESSRLFSDDKLKTVDTLLNE